MPVLGKVGLVNKGAYNSGTSYTALDFVKYNGSTYVALKGVQGVTPSNDGTNWSYLAQGADVTISNSQTVTTTGTALDAVQANKNVNGTLAYNIDQQITTLNDTKVNKSAPTLYFKINTQDGDPQTSYPHVELRSVGNASNGRDVALVRYTSASSSTNSVLMDKDGVFLPSIIERYGGFCSFNFNIPAGGSIALNVNNSARFMVMGTAPNTGVMFACLCATNGTGSATTVQDLYLGSSISHTSAQSKITFSNSNTSHSPKCLCIMFNDTPVVSV